ncbi:MAG: AI-2E family transporter, partial [Caldimonas sp.]
LVIVGLGMAAAMTLAYAVAGVPHAAFWGLLTGFFGLVPFGAAAAVAAVSVYLVALGSADTALWLFVFGAVLVFVIDHFVRPLFISGAARVPILLALIGIIGGLETLGLLGIFVGPTLMAVAITVWREIAEPDDPELVGPRSLAE